MDTKKILSYIVLLGGEAIIIAAFVLLGGSLGTDILVLNIVVSSLVYGLFFIDILVPWVDLKDKSGKKIGSLGVRWLFIWLYAIATIAVMLVGNLAYEWPFAVQIIIHCGLVFLLLLGLVAAFHSGDKVQEIDRQETFNRSGINEMKTAMQNLKDKINDLPDLPERFKNRINILDERLRFISPANRNEAYDLERQFVGIINDISFALADFSMNEAAIESNLKKAENVYQNRKSVYSN